MEGWSDCKLDELGSVSRGRSRHRPRNASHLYGGTYPFIQTGNIKAANLYITEYTQTYNEHGLAQSKLWDKNTLCITIAANIADTAILSFPACFPDSVIGFQAYKDKADVKYIKYYFDLYQKSFQQISQGATQDNLSAEKLLSIFIPTPPLPIQQKIAAVLSAYDDLIENNLRRIKLLEEMAQITYEEWFVRLRFPNYETTPINPETGLPDGWEVGQIKDIGNVVTGKTPSTTNADFFGIDVPFIKTPDMASSPYVIETVQYLSKNGANSQKNKYLPKNSLMVSCIATVGVTALVAIKSQTNQQINSIIFNNSNFSFYVYCFSRRLKPLLDGLGSNGATMTNVNKAKFENIEILLPKNDLLNKFHLFGEPIFDSILSLQNQNTRLREARDILLPRLMSGKLNVDDYTSALPLKDAA